MLSFVQTPSLSSSPSLQLLLQDVQHALSRPLQDLPLPKTLLQLHARKQLSGNYVTLHSSHLPSHLLPAVTKTFSICPIWLSSHLLTANTMNTRILPSQLPSLLLPVTTSISLLWLSRYLLPLTCTLCTVSEGNQTSPDSDTFLPQSLPSYLPLTRAWTQSRAADLPTGCLTWNGKVVTGSAFVHLMSSPLFLPPDSQACMSLC